MRIIDKTVSASPENEGFTRLNVMVQIESLERQLEYWIDFPRDLEPDLSEGGNWQAILLLALGSYFNESIYIDAPIDRQLYDNLRGVLHVWNSWFKEFHVVEIHAAEISNADKLSIPDNSGRKTLSCFSGGIDSLFTLARHHTEVLGDGDALVDDLLSIAGFNTDFNDVKHMIDHLAPFAERFERRLLPIITNIRYGDHGVETPYSVERWMCSVAHGSMLSLIPHLFEKRYMNLLVPATHEYYALIPWGSHPLTDPLFSSSTLSIQHEGTSFSRIERTRFLATSDLALGLMHVCWKDYKDGNCSHCEKCLRTMATLDLMGAKERATAFDWSEYSMDRIVNAWLMDDNASNYFLHIQHEATKYGRDDIATATAECIKKSAQRRKWFAVKASVRGAMTSNPVTRAVWSAIRRQPAPQGSLAARAAD